MQIRFSKIVDKELAKEKSERMMSWISTEITEFHKLIVDNSWVRTIKFVLEEVAKNLDNLLEYIPPWETKEIDSINISDIKF